MPHEFRHSALNIRLSGQIRQPLSPTLASILFSRLTAFNAFATLPERQVCPNRQVRGKPSTMSKFGIGLQAFYHPISSREASVDINKQVAALTASELQTAGASQATAIAVSVLLRHLRSPELVKLLSSAFENHQAVMLQTPWPDPMLHAFDSTRRFLEGAAQAELPGTQTEPPSAAPDA